MSVGLVSLVRMNTTQLTGLRVRTWHTAAALLTVLSAPVFFVLEQFALGALLLGTGLAVAYFADRGAEVRSFERGNALERPWAPAEARSSSGENQPSLLRDLSLIAIGLLVVRTISLAAELNNWAMVRFTLALGGAVLVPYLVSRFVYRDRATGFPWRARQSWGVWHWGWLAGVLVLGWLILPFYFIGSGVYQNWPVADSPELIARLFVGVGAVGIWDELFFICTVFAVLLRHFPAWLANILQAVIFVSFLWELGYRAWGPVLTIPFALVQGVIFLRTRSLGYVVTVHLLFDAVVFAVLVHAHNPALFDIFPTAP